MRQWKKATALGLGLALTFGQTTCAEVIIEPIPIAAETESTAAGSAPATAGEASGSVSSEEAGSAKTR